MLVIVWKREHGLGLISEDGRFEIRKRTERYNLRRVLVHTSYVLRDREKPGRSEHPTQRAA